VRTFTNVSDQRADLLVFIQGDRDKFQDVEMRPQDGDFIAEKFGAEMLAKLEAAGLRFTAGQEGSKAAAE